MLDDDGEITPQKAAQEILRRKKAKESLIDFTRYTMPTYVADPFHHVVAEALDEVARGQNDRLMIFAPPQHGKQVADETEVLTPAGWTTHGRLQPGDTVFHPSGYPVRVVAVSDKTPSQVRVEFTDGTVVLCHENHEWTVFDRSDSKRGWFTYETKYFLRTTKFGKPVDLFGAGRAVYQLPVPEPLQMPEAQLPLAPYAFGAWLGDGTSTKPCITHAMSDVVVIDAITGLGYAVSNVHTHPTTGVLTTCFGGPRPNVRSAFPQGLKDTGAMGDKHIPTAYKLGSLTQRLELLAGLIDTDGYVYQKNGRTVISTVSTVLANDIADVVRSLGVRACIHAQEACLSSSGIQGTKPTLQVSFTPSMQIPTRLARKRVTVLQTPRRIGIKSVTKVGSGASGRCIQVDSPDGLYLVTRSLVPTHNSQLSTRHFPAYFMARQPTKHVISASYNADFAKGFGRDVRDIVNSAECNRIFPGLSIRSDNRSVDEWQLQQGGKYTAVGVGTGATGKPAHIFLIDDPIKNSKEADSTSVREDQWAWYRSVVFTRLQEESAIVLTLTRWHHDDLAGRLLRLQAEGKGRPWKIIRLPAIAVPRHMPDGKPILNDDGSVPGDPLGRGPLDPLAPNRFSYGTLREKEEVLGPRTWSAMYQQEPIAEEGSMFRGAWFKPPDTLNPRRAKVRAWDLAASEAGDFTVGVLMSKDAQGTFVIEDVKRFRGSAMQVEQKIMDTARNDGRSVRIILPQDPGQAGKSQVEGFIRKLAGWTVKAQRPTGSKQTRAAAFASQAEHGNVRMVTSGGWQEAFIEEVETFPLGSHDDQVDAASDAFNALLGPRRAAVLDW